LPEGVEAEAQVQERGERESNASKWCKDEQNAQNQLKKHAQLESEVGFLALVRVKTVERLLMLLDRKLDK